jgi:phosphoadenosine phosphosulfate reductase
MREKVGKYLEAVRDKSPGEILDWALSTFGSGRFILSSSLSLEDQALTDMLLKREPAARILMLDTGRHFQETYDVIDATMKRYGMRYEILFPDTAEVEAMLREKGANLFYESVENRKRCCDVRKVRPLWRALSTVDAWITGQRASQAVTRTQLAPVEWDGKFGIVKINPLWNWSTRETWLYVKRNGVPFNALFEKGFSSIGCAPCTRAVGEGDDERAGRWWWESPEKKECGLHA